MERTKRQLAAQARQALAQILTTLDRGQAVAMFADRYISASKRPELKSNPEQYREMLDALRRESLLFAVMHAESVLPRYLPKPRRRARRGMTHAQAVKVFREISLEELARIRRWNPNDVFEFRRDLAIYEGLTARWAATPRTERRQSEAGGPFADRCALLLDPSMLDRARRSAAKFRSELIRLTNRVLRETFRPRRQK